MFKIGDFPKLTNISVKTLRHYDELGLFNAVQVDDTTGYRYYSFEQLPRLNRILVFKDLGFSLESVAVLLKDDLTADTLEQLLKLKQSELEAQLKETRERLERVSARLKYIHQEGIMPPHEVILKTVEPMAIASARETIAPEHMRGGCLALLDKVFKTLEQQKIKHTATTLALYHDNSEKGIDTEMAVVLEQTLPPATHDGVRLQTLPQVQMASVVYKGSFNAFDTVGKIHLDIGKWIESNGYQISGANREIYWQPPEDYSQDGVMEIQYPVVKG
jgi:DNA-binding transcriptional MerR regulator